jgi:PBP1b-binding outer membrane lipoprotein LpoB
MYKNICIALFFSLLFLGCSQKEPSPKQEVLKPSQKVFPQEDMYIMFALRAEQINDRATASELFNKLYEKSKKKEYLYRSLENDLVAKKNEELIERVDTLTQGSLDDYRLVRLKIVALVESHRVFEARSLALELLQKSKAQEDYLLVANIYIQIQEYNLALQYLESAYNKNKDEKVLDKMAVLLYANLHKQKEAIAQLETYIGINGCSTLICNRLLGIYSNENNIDGLLQTYLKLYKLNQDKASAKKIIQIYGYKQDYKNLMLFLEETHADDDTLLQVYSMQKKYKKALALADKLYEKKGEMQYLGQSAIYEYEIEKTKTSKKTLHSVIEKLEKVTACDESPVYLNYLGYILIDHEVDVKRGMTYIRKVLKIQPESSFYLDSLAWGYYKLGNCKKAKEIMNKVVTLEGGDDPEVKSHIVKINKCIKGKK